ncbi:hypothetical protein Vafri_6943 [Volvox africanus]|uniref:Uncharacterized protein n=1 Tax=Volvox africanus TaxID=51714 RepID=A0A8J4EXJ2_9CHLO|nr:hypothetical protein Vafri_6943 [Volvox africanus]
MELEWRAWPLGLLGKFSLPLRRRLGSGRLEEVDGRLTLRSLSEPELAWLKRRARNAIGDLAAPGELEAAGGMGSVLGGRGVTTCMLLRSIELRPQPPLPSALKAPSAGGGADCRSGEFFPELRGLFISALYGERDIRQALTGLRLA